jgi:hypothetical protein
MLAVFFFQIGILRLLWKTAPNFLSAPLELMRERGWGEGEGEGENTN